jgi:hypothetical protein
MKILEHFSGVHNYILLYSGGGHHWHHWLHEYRLELTFYYCDFDPYSLGIDDALFLLFRMKNGGSLAISFVEERTELLWEWNNREEME